MPVEAVRVADHEDWLSKRTRCLLRTTIAYHLLFNTIQIEIKPTFSPTTVPPPMRTFEMMMIAFITFKSSLVPLFEGL